MGIILVVQPTSLLCLQAEHRYQGVGSLYHIGLWRSLARPTLVALTRVLRVRLLLIRPRFLHTSAHELSLP